MESSLRQMNIIKMVMLASIVLYAIMAERMASVNNRVADSFFFAIAVMAVLMAITCFVLRRILVGPAEQTLQREPENKAALQRWRGGHMPVMAVSEAVALFGFVLRFQGAPLIRVAPFYIAGALLMLMLGPRRP
jgi:hypothetical protein